jgi:pimeloyl-ACP methyl ester carboxylesterase
MSLLYNASAVRPISLTAADGVTLDAVLHEPATAVSGTVIQAHGIGANLDEGGMYRRLADTLAGAGFAVVRFSFRGHGRSSGSSRGATLAGEVLDLEAAIELAVTSYPAPLSIVASSFAAVSMSLLLPYFGDQVGALVLWNPVLDLDDTFARPHRPWGEENFGPSQVRHLHEHGYLLLDGSFQVGRALYEEMCAYGDLPRQRLLASTMPALVVHGDRDAAVSYDIARAVAVERANCDFHTVQGSDHGFDTREREDESIQVTARWLGRRYRDHP